MSRLLNSETVGKAIRSPKSATVSENCVLTSASLKCRKTCATVLVCLLCVNPNLVMSQRANALLPLWRACHVARAKDQGVAKIPARTHDICSQTCYLGGVGKK